MSESFKANLHIGLQPSDDNAKGYTLVSSTDDGRWIWGDTTIVLTTKALDLEVDIPDEIELRKLAIKTLEDKQREIDIQAYKQKQSLQSQINKLLTITHVVGS